MTDGVMLRTDAFRVVQGSGDGRGDSLAAVVPARMRQPLPATVTATLGNVIPFLRPRATEVHAPDVVLPTDAARLPATPRAGERLRHAAFVVASIVLHGSIFAYFMLDEPVPLESIGVEVISAELVLGATAPAGAEQTTGKSEATVKADATDPQPTDPQSQAGQKATEQPQNVQVGPEETAPEQTTSLERQANERQPADNAAAPREERQPAEPKYSLAMVENPSTPEMATAAPKEIPPDTTEVSLLPQPEEKPVETTTEPVLPAPSKPVDKKPDPQATKAAPPKPVKDAAPAKERRRVDAPTRDKASRQAKASTPTVAASNVGVGRSSRDSNYGGIVRAHLVRHKRQLGSSTGSATVAFTIGGSGGVTSVRLARGSGVAAVDQEVQAMVRRASPFPPPPGGRSEQFSISVGFQSQ
jgi:periplasmic protein TonB